MPENRNLSVPRHRLWRARSTQLGVGMEDIDNMATMHVGSVRSWSARGDLFPSAVCTIWTASRCCWYCRPGAHGRVRTVAWVACAARLHRAFAGALQRALCSSFVHAMMHDKNVLSPRCRGHGNTAVKKSVARVEGVALATIVKVKKQESRSWIFY